MTTLYDVPPEVLIKRLGEELKKKKDIQPPAWASVVKTGVHREMPPEDPDWWFIRTGAVLRRIYRDGPVGVQRMRSVYGGKRDRGSRPNRFRKGSGAILRKIMQQLEKAGFVEKSKSGRSVTPAGRSFVDDIAHTLRHETAPSASRSAKTAE